MARTYTLTVNERSVEAEVWQDGDTFYVSMGQITYAVSLGVIDEGRLFSLLIDGASYEVHAHSAPGVFDLLVHNEPFRVEVERGHRRSLVRELKTEPGIRVLRSPMAGIVAEVAAAAGQTVERGTVLVILESMKMKNELRAEQAGIVERIDVRAGQQVERGAPLLQIKTEG